MYQELQGDTNVYNRCRGGLRSQRLKGVRLFLVATSLLCQATELALTHFATLSLKQLGLDVDIPDSPCLTLGAFPLGKSLLSDPSNPSN